MDLKPIPEEKKVEEPKRYAPIVVDPNHPKNWRTVEQLLATFKDFDFEGNGHVSLESCHEALTQSGIGLFPETLEKHLRSVQSTSW